MDSDLSVIIRTIPGREQLLDRCLFVLAAQTFDRIEVIVVAQFSGNPNELSKVESVVGRWRSRFRALHIVANHADFDARARSLNLGIAHATGRYIAFLDDDDKVYPPHYETLVGALNGSSYAWAYSDVILAGYNRDGQLVSRTMPFQRLRYSFLYHLKENFIPIHSFVVDRLRANDMPTIDESLCRLEDYDFLLRLASKYEPLHVPFVGCEYCVREDGTNSLIESAPHIAARLERERVWNEARMRLEERKYSLVGWWMREVAELRETTRPDAESRQQDLQAMLQDYYKSTSWRLTRPLRNLRRRLAKLPAEAVPIASSEADALAALVAIQSSASWELTAPIRLLKRLLMSVRSVHRQRRI